jgi:DNA polymerase
MDSRSLIGSSLFAAACAEFVALSRSPHHSTHPPCQFLDRGVNGGEESRVGGEVETIANREARSALSWWLDAGVDIAIQDEPRNWLAPAPRRDGPAKAQSNVVQPDQATLAELQQWLSSSVQLPLAGPAAKRVLPHGPEHAPVMLLSDHLTIEESTAARPIAGDAWALAERMLAAIGFKADDPYSASLSCFHAPRA